MWSRCIKEREGGLTCVNAWDVILPQNEHDIIITRRAKVQSGRIPVWKKTNRCSADAMDNYIKSFKENPEKFAWETEVIQFLLKLEIDYINWETALYNHFPNADFISLTDVDPDHRSIYKIIVGSTCKIDYSDKSFIVNNIPVKFIIKFINSSKEEQHLIKFDVRGKYVMYRDQRIEIKNFEIVSHNGIIPTRENQSNHGIGKGHNIIVFPSKKQC